ncbi:MAG TPA: DUF4215 domain-containing protein, partial [Myxococcota bacterium]|nr:DUF4215 domain-containing protein [Myxococcota bacterium]
FRGASSATSQVEVIDVVQPWEGHGPRIDTLEAQVADLQAQLDALRADLLAVDGDVGFILADYVTHGELPTAGGTFSGAERPADPPIGAIYVRPDGDVEVFDGFGWRSIGASTICGDGYLADGEACDDGNDVDTDACTSVCQPAACGDGFIQPGEACDDGNAVNTDACTGACELAACGDGFVQAGEACDDGNAVDTDACSNACQAQGALTVFVTSQAWTGSLGGVAGADAKCQAAAQAGGRSGTFVAFLSTSGLNAKDRVEDTEYRRFDGTVVAPDLAGLTTNNLSAAVLTDEFGAATPSDTFDTWTGTNYQGLWFGSSNDDCSGWSTAAGNGITGGSHRTEQVLWKAWNREACTNLRRLYCFEVYP